MVERRLFIVRDYARDAAWSEATTRPSTDLTVRRDQDEKKVRKKDGWLQDPFTGGLFTAHVGEALGGYRRPSWRGRSHRQRTGVEAAAPTARAVDPTFAGVSGKRVYRGAKHGRGCSGRTQQRRPALSTVFRARRYRVTAQLSAASTAVRRTCTSR